MALQLARALAGAIQRGEVKPGEGLPGTRTLAETLDLSRYAVMGALKELELEGYVEIRPGSGATVAAAPPARPPRAWGRGPEPAPAAPSKPAFDVSSLLAPISQLGGVAFDVTDACPDPRLMPQVALARAYRRALSRHGDELLAPGEPKGNLQLRQELAEFLRRQRGLRLEAEQIHVTRGLRHGLGILLELLLPHGGALGVEAPGAPEVLEALRGRPGLITHGLPVDAQGADPDALSRILEAHPLKAVLLRPYDQVPTGASLPLVRRQAFLDLASRHRLALLEDDSGFAFGPASPAPLPLAAEDRQGSVLYLLSFARLLAPGLQLGLLAGPRELVDRFARLRRNREQQGDRVLEWALADLLRDGEVDRALLRNARLYESRVRRCAAALGEALGPRLARIQTQGLGLWIHAGPGFDLKAWQRSALVRGVKMRSPEAFGHGTPPDPALYLGCGALEEADLDDAIPRLRAAAEDQG